MTSRFHQALAYASMMHQDQRRKKTEVPYVAHLLSVCSIALNNGANETEAIAAVLHDVVEDQGGLEQLARIESLFGLEVGRIVYACSDSVVDATKGQPKEPWYKRKREYLDHLAVETDPSVLLVAACDKLDNLRAIVRDYREVGDALWARFNGGKDGTIWYHNQIARTIGDKVEIDARLARIAAELSELARTLPEPNRKFDPAEIAGGVS